MSEKTEKAAAAASEGMNIISVLCTGLAILGFLGGVGVFLYEVFGLLSGNGWNTVQLSDLLFWLLGPPAAAAEMGTGTKILAVLSMAPLDIALVALGWIFSKIGDLFEKMS
jgi:hypothetical protein